MISFCDSCGDEKEVREMVGDGLIHKVPADMAAVEMVELQSRVRTVYQTPVAVVVEILTQAVRV